MSNIQNIFNLKEGQYKEIQDIFAKKVLDEFFFLVDNDNILETYYFDDSIEGLLSAYMLLKKENSLLVSSLENLLKKYNFDYHMPIHNGIYYLLENDVDKSNIDATWWPGIHSYECIDEKSGYYLVETKLGKIKVYKANVLLKDEFGINILNRRLNGDCYNATYNYLMKNPKYHAVVSLLPYFFKGTHFHAYLESDDGILDIASNAFYEDKSLAKIVLNDEIIIKLNKNQVIEEWEELSKDKKISNDNKLLSIALNSMK